MLVLTRRVGEAIMIEGRRVVIRVEEIIGSKVKLSFDCAREIKIEREENFNARPQGDQSAAG